MPIVNFLVILLFRTCHLDRTYLSLFRDAGIHFNFLLIGIIVGVSRPKLFSYFILNYIFISEMRSLTLLTLLGACLGQKPARIGPDGKPLLNRPDVTECMKSEINRHEWPTAVKSSEHIFFRKNTHEGWKS